MKGNNESKTRPQFLNCSKSKQPSLPQKKKPAWDLKKKQEKYSKRWKILKETKELDM
jgi:hypothetical protein